MTLSSKLPTDASRLFALYETKLEEASEKSGINRETLHNAVTKFHPRWIRANLPPGFPQKLGLK
jgi:hypothetical protein